MHFSQVSRLGVYGVVLERERLLLVAQEQGPYAGKLDLPGGKLEFGETLEQALHREFFEELHMDFQSMQLMTNLTVCIEVPAERNASAYCFHHVGLIYKVKDHHSLASKPSKALLKSVWADVDALEQAEVSPFVWMACKLLKRCKRW